MQQEETETWHLKPETRTTIPAVREENKLA
jgi:hypothetical protein